MGVESLSDGTVETDSLECQHFLWVKLRLWDHHTDLGIEVYFPWATRMPPCISASGGFREFISKITIFYPYWRWQSHNCISVSTIITKLQFQAPLIITHWNVSLKLNQFRDSLDCIVLSRGRRMHFSRLSWLTSSKHTEYPGLLCLYIRAEVEHSYWEFFFRWIK